jgi:GxxExxY protein
MPVQCTIPIHSVSLDDFRGLDYRVMNYAFECQNAIGGLADELIYQADFAIRLLAAGFRVDREVEVVISHNTFAKSLFLDLVVNQAAVYELKAVKSLNDSHRSQLLTYLNVLDLERGKLVNFATDKVQAEFVNAAIPAGERRDFSIHRKGYCGPESFCEMVVELVRDWGTCLSVNLYHEAVVHMLGGAASTEVLIPMTRDGIKLGSQRFHLIFPDEAFKITAITKPGSGFENHLERLFALSPLKFLHWINISYHEIQFCTIRK